MSFPGAQRVGRYLILEQLVILGNYETAYVRSDEFLLPAIASFLPPPFSFFSNRATVVSRPHGGVYSNYDVYTSEGWDPLLVDFR